MINELKKKLKETEVELETVAFEAEKRHSIEIEAAKVTVVEEHKNKILNLGRRFTFDGYNLYLKKMAKAYPDVDTEMLELVKVYDVEGKEYKDDEDPEDSTVPHAS
ncbi:hypothetical protein F0562_019771 [Nyssa sinensis]|uniref:Uncharacterized protein n=1 Tax=Nyssa sinensis TaxID=561372 RepID=A0A5J5BTE7_9ASTE|nr:hypothetical protein F0562_019771 [Nyssa sinensis]